jgi:UDP-N-acetylglucosamine/UDP-N-acetylgalactosamine diphosphorylase
MSREDFERIKKILDKYNQGHLLAFYHQLGTEQQEKLLKQIENLDFPQIDAWVSNLVKKPAHCTVASNPEPAPYYQRKPTPTQQGKYEEAKKLGEKLITAGKVAGFVVAGGQGTRLGFDGPKGDFPLSPIKKKTLFRIFVETIAAVSKRYNTVCPWYVMTSPLNHDATCEIFRKNKYYGLAPENIFIFQQAAMPNFSFDGKILLADKDSLACSPDGHGGSLKALYQSGALDDMKNRGIEYISYWQVDNCLVRLFDPLFIGLHALDAAEMSSKGLLKRNSKEKVGNFCLVDDKVTVIEYSDLPDELAEKRKPDGSLFLELGSIAIHLLSRGFVERLNCGGFRLPLHRAVKKIPYVDKNGNLVRPEKPNGIKLETFVFDALPLASKSIILQTSRSQEFAPIKNATGVNSAKTARQMMIDRAADWLESAGINVPKKQDGRSDCTIEIAPSFALEKADIKAKLAHIPEIRPGDILYLE